MIVDTRLVDNVKGEDINYRMSTEQDKEGIEGLIKSRFGIRSKSLEDLDNRYILAINSKGTVIAMTGLKTKGNLRYKGYSIERTCILQEYEGNGIITGMLSYIIKDAHGRIFCNCLRRSENGENVHLHHAMTTLGFREVIRNNEQWHAEYNCNSYNTEDCIWYHEGCKCYCDLWLLDKA